MIMIIIIIIIIIIVIIIIIKTTSNSTIEINQPQPKHLKTIMRKKVEKKFEEEVKRQVYSATMAR